jgi:hypothetical protein
MARGVVTGGFDAGYFFECEVGDDEGEGSRGTRRLRGVLFSPVLTSQRVTASGEPTLTLPSYCFPGAMSYAGAIQRIEFRNGPDRPNGAEALGDDWERAAKRKKREAAAAARDDAGEKKKRKKARKEKETDRALSNARVDDVVGRDPLSPPEGNEAFGFSGAAVSVSEPPRGEEINPTNAEENADVGWGATLAPAADVDGDLAASVAAGVPVPVSDAFPSGSLALMDGTGNPERGGSLLGGPEEARVAEGQTPRAGEGWPPAQGFARRRELGARRGARRGDASAGLFSAAQKCPEAPERGRERVGRASDDAARKSRRCRGEEPGGSRKKRGEGQEGHAPPQRQSARDEFALRF